MPISTSVRFIKRLARAIKTDKYDTFGLDFDRFEGMYVPVPQEGIKYRSHGSDWSSNEVIHKKAKAYREWKKKNLHLFVKEKENYIRRKKWYKVIFRALKRALSR